MSLATQETQEQNMQETKKYDISVFIPVYNEEESIEILQGKIEEAMSQSTYTYEVIYVDDGSSDSSLILPP